jgi:asparagine synthase (glutamine-hydrolysing)
MCGIAGIWNYKTQRPVDPGRLRLMTDLLSHRGPDGDGFYCKGSVGLGHRRLSIIDVAGGHQPMSNEDGSIWITFNGEIYNFQELREPLVKKGHVFKTRSDTEVIVHLYEEIGPDCFEKLRGMFALALWDSRNQQLILARDRIGIKPLQYGLFHDGIVFASELNSIRAAAELPLKIEPTAIAQKPSTKMSTRWKQVTILS